jgi:hypothetical protein
MQVEIIVVSRERTGEETEPSLDSVPLFTPVFAALLGAVGERQWRKLGVLGGEARLRLQARTA